MSLSKHARRGIAVFNKIQTSPTRLRYMMRRMTVENPYLAPNILQAAQAAAEAINASVQSVPQQSQDPLSDVPQTGSSDGVSAQQKDHQEDAKGTPGGPLCGDC